jgi:hypothetical protein
MTPPRPLPGPGDTTQLTRLLNEYIESDDMDAVIGYIASHS